LHAVWSPAESKASSDAALGVPAVLIGPGGLDRPFDL
jgi:hypothetical protein